MSTEEHQPVFPKGRTTEAQTWATENALCYLAAAAQALRTSASYSLDDLPQAETLLAIADDIEQVWIKINAEVTEIKRAGS